MARLNLMFTPKPYNTERFQPNLCFSKQEQERGGGKVKNS